MSVRETLSQNRVVGAVVVVVCLGVIAAVGYSLLGRSNAGPLGEIPVKGFFLDTDTDAVFAWDITAIPPVVPTGKSAASGVRLHVYSCGNCRDKGTQFHGYLETNTPESKQARIDMDKLENGQLQGGVPGGGGLPALQAIAQAGEQVAAPAKPYQWVEKTSDEGRQAMDAPKAKCGDKPATECYPK